MPEQRATAQPAVGEAEQGREGAGPALPQLASGAARVLFLQRAAGNHAVANLIARRGGKPDAPKGTSSDVSELEEAVGKDDYASGSAAAQRLYDQGGAAYLADLLYYKLEKHAGKDRKKFDNYVNFSPVAARVELLELACRKRNSPMMASLSWVINADTLAPDDHVRIASHAPGLFINAIIEPERRGREPQRLVEMLQNRVLVDLLKTQAPGEYQQLAIRMPQLGVGEQAVKRAGAQASDKDVVDQVFWGIILNQGIDVAYLATKSERAIDVLAGPTKYRQEGMETRRKANPTLPAVAAMDCHSLVGLFVSIVNSIPSLTVNAKREMNPYAVLTKPLNTVRGGLVHDFGGNFFAGGSASGQIFFSGTGGKDSHSWVRAGTNLYDILFGTTDDAVTGFVGAEYEPLEVDPTDPTKVLKFRKRSGAGPATMYMRPDLVPPANPYSFTSGYAGTQSGGG